MSDAATERLAVRARHLSVPAAVLTGAALMVAGQQVFAVVPLIGGGLPVPGASALLVVPVVLAGIVMLWSGPVVVALAAGQPVWIGSVAFPGAAAVWVFGTQATSSLADGAALTVVEGALPVFSFAGALAVVGGGRVWRRLAGVAVIAALVGALSHLFQDPPAVVSTGLVVAFGFLVLIAPRTRPPCMPASANPTATSPSGGE